MVLEGNVAIFDRGNHKIGFASSNLTDPETGRPCGLFLDFIFLYSSVSCISLHYKNVSSVIIQRHHASNSDMLAEAF